MNALSRLLARFTFLRWMALVCLMAGAAHAAGLNDTGITDCSNDDGLVTTGVEADTGTHPRQDCRYGRDPAALTGMPKVGDGGKGFDFSKIGNDGTVLDATATLGTGAKDWACTRDNVTGLIWEVKTTSGMRSQSHSYSWYSNNPATNGGWEGAVSRGTCATAGRCDTEKFVADVNAASLCGATDWRMPTRRELISIVDYGRTYSAVDPTYFPNTAFGGFWSASTNANGESLAWWVSFIVGASNSSFKDTANMVRLVRAGQ